MANPIQQGLKHYNPYDRHSKRHAAMANPIQQGLKLAPMIGIASDIFAAMANPIQQGLKHVDFRVMVWGGIEPQWLIQYNKD